METGQTYVVEITPEAEQYYQDLLEHLYTTHSEESAFVKSEEILLMAISLEKMPNRGSDEPLLSYLEKGHKYLVYPVTSRKTVKIIYFVEEQTKKVFVTDFFPTEKNPAQLAERNRMQ